LVYAQDPEWQLRILEVHAQFSVPWFDRVLNMGMVMVSVCAGTLFGALLSGSQNVIVVSTLFAMTLAILLVLWFMTRVVSRQQDKLSRGLQCLGRGQVIPDFAKFLEEI
jgi:HAMP domain-containing protein